MRDEELLRYSRQIMLPEMDVAGQQKLLDATVLIVGMGGLGCPAAMYLAAAGVGHLIIADDDTVEITNLQRQIAHGQADVGQPKVLSALATLKGLNPDVRITPLQQRLTAAELDDIVPTATLVLDACDNFTTRFELNQACVKHRVPLVSGAAIRMEGQVAVFDSRDETSPCYQCLYKLGDDEQATCSRNGVMAPVVGIIGAVQAMEAIKMISAVGKSLTGRLLLLDAKNMQWREMRLPRDPHCSVCGTDHEVAADRSGE
ncbi:MAG: molybdopterin-synthase adenylyltransferase MoeB [Gammaproteobacteria bacterium]|nr:molybdopterin-synthase adenylyltransferase MoeB [Gammaproteobacteria bacterium]MDP2141657.1 molybdopterin-synthase adenylyltransferase MoeB [Gammaproteobacteria bacterium]MDP2347892.1 molybdopterin-synthase adenylyltransferase MoeB [Gammaproteobacteria bacterium]